MRLLVVISALLLFSSHLHADMGNDLLSTSQELIGVRQGLLGVLDSVMTLSTSTSTNANGVVDYSDALVHINYVLERTFGRQLLQLQTEYDIRDATQGTLKQLKADSAVISSILDNCSTINQTLSSIHSVVSSYGGYFDDIISLFEETETYIMDINGWVKRIENVANSILTRLDGIFKVQMIDEQWGVIDKALIDFQKSFDGALAELRKISNNTQNEGSHGFGSDQQDQLDKIAKEGITAEVDLTPVLNAMTEWRDSQSDKWEDIRSWGYDYLLPLVDNTAGIAENLTRWEYEGLGVHVLDLPVDLYETIRTRSDVMWDNLEPYLKKLVDGGGTNSLAGATDKWFGENGDTVKKYWVDSLEDKDRIFKESIKEGFDAGNWWQRYGGDNYTWFHLAGDATNVSEAVNSPLEMDFVNNWYDAVVALLHQNGTIAADINKFLYSAIGDASSAKEEEQEEKDYISDTEKEYGGEEGWRGHVQFDGLSNFVEGHKVGAADNVANALSLGEGSIAEQLSLVLPAYTYGDFNMGTDDMTITQTELPSAFTTVIEGCHAVARFCWYSLAVSIHFFFLWLFVKLARSEVIAKLVSVQESHMFGK